MNGSHLFLYFSLYFLFANTLSPCNFLSKNHTLVRLYQGAEISEITTSLAYEYNLAFPSQKNHIYDQLKENYELMKKEKSNNLLCNITLNHQIEIAFPNITEQIKRTIQIPIRYDLKLKKYTFEFKDIINICSEAKYESSTCIYIMSLSYEYIKNYYEHCNPSIDNESFQYLLYKQNSTEPRITKFPIVTQQETVISVPWNGTSSFQEMSSQIVSLCFDNNLSLPECHEMHKMLIKIHPSSFSTEKTENIAYLTSPEEIRSYPINRQMYLSWELGKKGRKLLDRKNFTLCFFHDYSLKPVWCDNLPKQELVYVPRFRGLLGTHMVRLGMTHENISHTSFSDNSSTAVSFSFLDTIFYVCTDPKVNVQVDLHQSSVPPSNFNAAISIEYHNYVLSRLLSDEVCLLINGEISCINMVYFPFIQRKRLESGGFQIKIPINAKHLSSSRLSITALIRNNYTHVQAISPRTLFTIPPDDTELRDSDFIDKGQKHVNSFAFRPSKADCQNMWTCNLREHEWGYYSQNGEDGILQYIFKNINTTNKFYVEFGVENGLECNTRFLREIDNWKGLLMDGGYENKNINLHKHWIQAENINELFKIHSVPASFDLLSIDIDYNDFWIWYNIDATRYRPRVVIVEYNSHFPNESITVPYNSSGSWDGKTSYFGATIDAFNKLAESLNYSLVYCESHGVNCFFIANEALHPNERNARTLQDIYRPPNFHGRNISYPKKENTNLQDHWIRI